jgi:hypothetical protein
VPLATPYAFRFSAGPALVVRGTNTVVEVKAERDGAAATIAAANYSLVTPGGVALVTTQPGSVSGGAASYTVLGTATSGQALAPHYVETWDITIGGQTYTAKRDLALAACLLHCPVADSDLFRERRDLARADFLPADVASWQEYIDAAWADVVDRLVEDGVRYWRIRSPQRLRRPVLCLALRKIMEDLTTRMEAGDKYEADIERWENRYEAAWGRMVLLVDQDEDGVIDAEEAEVPTVILTGRRLPGLAGW